MISTTRFSNRRRLLARLGPLGAVAGVALVLSGCLSSGYTYLSHANSDKTVLYFKLPTSWNHSTFSSDQRSVNGGLTQTQANQLQAGISYYVSFIGTKNGKPNLLNNLAARHPQGIAFVAQLTSSEREQFSLIALRSQVLGQDPLTVQPTSTAQPLFTPLSGSEFTKPGGIRGSRFVTDVRDAGGLQDTFAQIAEVDPQTNLIFVLAIGCRASCWSQNQSTINQILNTWNVKELVHG